MRQFGSPILGMAGITLLLVVVPCAALAAEKVRLQLGWDHQFTHAGFYAAKWLGYYEEAGLDVEILSAFDADGKFLRAPEEVAQGRVEFGVGASNVLVAVDKGAPLVVIASIYQQSPVAFFALKGTGLSSPADLARLRVSRRVNDQLDVEMQAMLRAEGIDPSKVTPYPRETTLDGLVEGRVDVIPGFITLRRWQARSLGIDVEILRPSSYGIDFYANAIFTHRRLADDAPELVTKFRDASIRGWRYALENPEEIADRISSELPRTLPLADMEAFNRYEAEDVRKLMLYPLVQIGHTNPDRWRRMNQLLREAGVVTRDELDVDTFIFDPKRRQQRQQAFTLTLALASVGVLCAIVLIILGINVILRRAVAAKTRDLQASEGRLAFAQEMAHVGSYDWDRANDALIWSDETYRIFGRRPGDRQLSVSTFMDSVQADDRGRVDEAIREAIEQKAPYNLEFRIIRPDGTERVVVDRGRVVLGPTGDVMRLQGALQDISERKQMEHALHQRDEQLHQAQKMEALGQLTGGIAHDFNNLLAVIVGNIELLEESLETGDSVPEEQIDAITQAAARGASMTQHLLAFSRKQALEPQVVDLNAIITSLTGMLRRSLGETIEVETLLPDSLWQCEVDPGQLQNALLNLAVNARDAMPGGGKLKIEVANARIDDADAAAQADITPGDYVVLAVSDTGTGMAPEIVERVCEPFFTTKETGKGSGLGLSMVYGFAMQSGGRVSIISEVGRGTTVKLLLPRAPATADHSGSSDAADARGHRERILVLEDDIDVRRLTASLLRNLGYEVDEAEDGATAIEVLEKTARIDVLLTDVVLPGGMGGTAVARKATTLHPGIKVIYMSGYADNEIVEQQRTDDNIIMLHKPFRKAELAYRLREALERGAE